MDGNTTKVERVSDVELVVTRRVKGPARLIYQAWSTPDLFTAWWVPKSFGITLLSCQMDVRTGGAYRLVFALPGSDQTMAFFGSYLEVVPDARIVWTNQESPDGSVTTATFAEAAGVTLVTVRDLYPTKAALDEAVESGSTGAWPEQFDALDALLAG